MPTRKKGANQKKKKNLQKYQRKKWWSQCSSTHGVDSNDYVTHISTFHHLYCRFHIITWNQRWKNQGNTQKIRGNERNRTESIPNFECILNRNHVDLHMKPWRYWVDDGDWNSEQKLFERFENKNNNWLLLRFITVRTSYSSNYRYIASFLFSKSIHF